MNNCGCTFSHILAAFFLDIVPFYLKDRKIDLLLHTVSSWRVLANKILLASATSKVFACSSTSRDRTGTFGCYSSSIRTRTRKLQQISNPDWIQYNIPINQNKSLCIISICRGRGTLVSTTTGKASKVPRQRRTNMLPTSCLGQSKVNILHSIFHIIITTTKWS